MVFAMFDDEPELTGEDAGRVADAAELAVLAAMDDDTVEVARGDMRVTLSGG